jgi:hypothetical protein
MHISLSITRHNSVCMFDNVSSWSSSPLHSRARIKRTGKLLQLAKMTAPICCRRRCTCRTLVFDYYYCVNVHCCCCVSVCLCVGHESRVVAISHRSAACGNCILSAYLRYLIAVYSDGRAGGRAVVTLLLYCIVHLLLPNSFIGWCLLRTKTSKSKHNKTKQKSTFMNQIVN